MSWRIRRTVSRAVIGAASPAICFAQPATPPPATFPPTAQLPPEPAPAPPPDTAPPAPAPAPPPAGPPPGYAAAAPPSAETRSYAQTAPDTGFYPQPVPPPPTKPSSGFEMPAWSVRIDPFNWLLDGRLGVELETEVLSFMTVELVPMFVVNDQPPFIANAYDEEVTQHSNGVGALAGTSLGVGFWFSRKILRGTVFRVIFSNYGMTYRSHDGDGEEIDEVSRTERRLYAFLGSHSVLGDVFTIAGGVGLGVELNRQKRCFVEGEATSDCRKEGLELRREFDRPWDLNPFAYPVQIMGRISLGVTFF